MYKGGQYFQPNLTRLLRLVSGVNLIVYSKTGSGSGLI